MSSSGLRIVLTGGGSGGHVYPLLSIVEELRRIAVEKRIFLELYYLGPSDSWSELLRNEHVQIQNLSSGKIRRYFSAQNILDVPRFFIGTLQALWKLYWIMPNLIFSKGGTGALPVVLAGRFYRIPVMIHESDATPGLTNLISSRFAARIAVSFDRAQNYFRESKTAWVGTPVRVKLLEDVPTKESAKQELGFDPARPLTLVLGGSQGSRRVNEFIVLNLEGLLKMTQVFHQTGKENYAEVERLVRAALAGFGEKTGELMRYEPVGYFGENLKYALAAADLVIARAGSTTIFEIAAFGKPSVLIPLREAANDHQRVNAYEYAKGGAAAVIEEENLLPGIFLNQVREALTNKNLANKMRAAANRFFRPDAAEVIAKEIIRLTVGGV